MMRNISFRHLLNNSSDWSFVIANLTCSLACSSLRQFSLNFNHSPFLVFKHNFIFNFHGDSFVFAFFITLNITFYIGTHIFINTRLIAASTLIIYLWIMRFTCKNIQSIEENLLFEGRILSDFA